MRQKMAIFKDENSVVGYKIFPSFHFYIFLCLNFDFFMGAMLMKIVILLRENESHITKN